MGMLATSMGMFFADMGMFTAIMGMFVVNIGLLGTAIGMFAVHISMFEAAMGTFAMNMDMFEMAIGLFVLNIGMFAAYIGMFGTAIGLFGTSMGVFKSAMDMFALNMGMFVPDIGMFAVNMGVIGLSAACFVAHAVRRVRADGREVLDDHNRIRAVARNGHAMPIPALPLMDVDRPVHDPSPSTGQPSHHKVSIGSVIHEKDHGRQRLTATMREHYGMLIGRLLTSGLIASSAPAGESPPGT